MRRTFTVARRAASSEPDEQRRKLLRELHDSVGPVLAATVLGVHGARRLLRTDPTAADQILVRLAEELRSAIAEIRRLASDAHPPVLDRLGLAEAVRQYAQTLDSRTATAGGRLDVRVEVCGDLPVLPAAVEVAAYRIACEALTNVATHSDASTCVVYLRYGDELQIEVVDDGTGGAADLPGGVGLSSMRERAHLLGGDFVVARASPGGTRVAARLPVNRN